MSQDLMTVCTNSTDVQKYIQHFGRKINRVYPRLLDREDAENELWVAVFRAIRERFKPHMRLIPFAMNAVFSQYGSMIKRRGNVTRLMNERVDTDVEVTQIDRSYEEIEVNFTLDQIEHDLMMRAKAGRQYRYAFRTFGMLRNGATIRECCEKLEISKQYGYKLFHEIIRESGEKYQENTISTDQRTNDT